MQQFITPEMLAPKENPYAHDITAPVVLQDHGDRAHRACWTLVSTCKKCGSLFIHASGMDYWEDSSFSWVKL